MPIHLKSSIDGFKVMLGSWYLNLAVLITLIVAVRPAKYDLDDAKTKEARQLYIVLIAYHLVFSAGKYYAEYKSTKFYIKIFAIAMMLPLALQIYLC